MYTIFKNMTSPASFVYQTNITILPQIYVKNVPSSIQRWDSNPVP